MTHHSPNHQNQKSSTPFFNWKVPQSRAYMIGGGAILATIAGIIIFGQHDPKRSVFDVPMQAVNSFLDLKTCLLLSFAFMANSPPTVGKAADEVEEVKRLVAEKTAERSRRH